MLGAPFDSPSRSLVAGHLQVDVPGEASPILNSAA
jgi:hypothetical protein